jgi:hypothetical protein
MLSRCEDVKHMHDALLWTLSARCIRLSANVRWHILLQVCEGLPAGEYEIKTAGAEDVEVQNH